MAPHTVAAPLFFAGDRSLLERPCVAIVGSREASEMGILRARRLARELVAAGVVVVAGLARGIDVAAHQEAIDCVGRTIAVIGTPLERAYPAEHAGLQDEIAAHHLVVSPFAAGSAVTRASFPARNRVMAALCQASVIVEATERQAHGTRLRPASATIGTSSSALVANAAVRWPQQLTGPRTHVLSSTGQVLERLALGGRP